MDGERQSRIDRRLARIEGQVRGVRRLVDQGAYCCDVLNQIAAVRSALDQVAAQIATDHIRHCVLEPQGPHAHPNAKAMEPEALHEELEEVLRRLMR